MVACPNRQVAYSALLRLFHFHCVESAKTFSHIVFTMLHHIFADSPCEKEKYLQTLLVKKPSKEGFLLSKIYTIVSVTLNCDVIIDYAEV